MKGVVDDWQNASMLNHGFLSAQKYFNIKCLKNIITGIPRSWPLIGTQKLRPTSKRPTLRYGCFKSWPLGAHEMYPGWSARDNYAQSKKKKRKRETETSEYNINLSMFFAQCSAI